jgi:hypothetical protein
MQRNVAVERSRRGGIYLPISGCLSIAWLLASHPVNISRTSRMPDMLSPSSMATYSKCRPILCFSERFAIARAGAEVQHCSVLPKGTPTTRSTGTQYSAPGGAIHPVHHAGGGHEHCHAQCKRQRRSRHTCDHHLQSFTVSTQHRTWETSEAAPETARQDDLHPHTTYCAELARAHTLTAAEEQQRHGEHHARKEAHRHVG